jgi:hypothetical protein
MAYSRAAELSFNGVIIRGQHEGDVGVTGSGIEKSQCRHCGKEFSRWIEAKLARLVRNEVEGSVHWGSRNDFDHEKFDSLMAIRKEEVKFCSEECQQRGPSHQPIKVRPAKPVAEQIVSSSEKAQDNGKMSKITPKRRGQ